MTTTQKNGKGDSKSSTKGSNQGTVKGTQSSNYSGRKADDEREGLKKESDKKTTGRSK